MARLPADPGPGGRALLSLDDARERVAGPLRPTPEEIVPVADAVGRVLARAVVAAHDQPPFAASAMDGWAIRHADAGGPLAVVGEAAAGHPFARALGGGEAVRIGTGAMVPEGADHVLIQEEAERDGDRVRATAAQERPGNIRRAGRDFAAGQEVLAAAVAVEPRHVGLIAAAGVDRVPVRRRPRVAVLTSGDELRDPGAPLDLAQIVDSASRGLPALIDGWGGAGEWRGRAPDAMGPCVALWRGLTDCDLVVTVGGASVGDRDLLRQSLVEAGGRVDWSGVAIRPGKPSWGGATGDTPVLGLPGNPAAALVTARLLLRPALTRMLGQGSADPPLSGRLAAPMPANGWREAHERARSWIDAEGAARLEPIADGDSSRLSPFATADALIERPAGAEALGEGGAVRFRMV